jgi:hypothetical protein
MYLPVRASSGGGKGASSTRKSAHGAGKESASKPQRRGGTPSKVKRR